MIKSIKYQDEPQDLDVQNYSLQKIIKTRVLANRFINNLFSRAHIYRGKVKNLLQDEYVSSEEMKNLDQQQMQRVFLQKIFVLQNWNFVSLLGHQQINQDVAEEQIQKFIFLKKTFTSQTIKEVAKILEIICFTPEQTICKQQDNDPSLYFILSGKVKIYEKQSKKQLSILHPGEKFGEFELFTGSLFQYSAKCLISSIIFKISRQKFLNILHSNQLDYQKFQDIKDDIQFNNNFSKCLSHCKICNSTSHLDFCCSLLTYKFYINDKLEREKIQKTNERKRFFYRRKKKFQNALFSYTMTKIESEIQQFRKLKKILINQFDILFNCIDHTERNDEIKGSIDQFDAIFEYQDYKTQNNVTNVLAEYKKIIEHQLYQREKQEQNEREKQEQELSVDQNFELASESLVKGKENSIQNKDICSEPNQQLNLTQNDNQVE